MAKKKSDKEAEQKPASTKKYVAFFRNETIHFVIGLVLVIFSVYLLLAFTSFFFTGAADQSIIDSGNAQDLAAVNNHVKELCRFPGSSVGKLPDQWLFWCFLFLYFNLSGCCRTQINACACGTPLEMVYRMFIAAHLVFCFPWFRFYGPLSGLLHLSGWIAWL